MLNIISRIFKSISKSRNKNETKFIPTNDAIKFVKKSMKKYSKVYEKLAKKWLTKLYSVLNFIIK